jgi:hypothetical protein
MSQFQVQGKKIEKEEPKLKLVPLRNDRPLEELELIAEQKAEKLSIKFFKRIPPNPGTLGYLFRDLIGGNHSVFEFVKAVLPASNFTGSAPAKKVGTEQEKLAKRVILTWNALDDHSKNRVDVFDWLCDKVGLARNEFYGISQKGMFNNYEAISQRVLMEAKPELIHNVRQFARVEGNFRDRELLAKATGVTKEAPLIGTLDASTKINNNLLVESNFNSSIKESEREIREIENDFIEGETEDIKPRELGEGNVDYLNTEIIEQSEEELLAVLRR